MPEIWKKVIIFHEKFGSLGRKMDFYMTTSASYFPCFQITWQTKSSYHRYWLRFPFKGPVEVIVPLATSNAAMNGGINLWHQRLGHLNKDDVKRTIGCEDNLKEVCKHVQLQSNLVNLYQRKRRTR